MTTAYRVGEPRNYETKPVITVPQGVAWSGGQIWPELDMCARQRRAVPVIAIDCYPGVQLDHLSAIAAQALPEYRIINVEQAAWPIQQINQLIAANLTDDRVFGVLSHHSLSDFYDNDALTAIETEVDKGGQPTLLVGWGATLAAPDGSVLVLADLARWEIQQRLRAGMPNWHCSNEDEDVLRKYKRGFFIEWRVADRHKRELFDALDFVLDTTRAEPFALVTGEGFRLGLATASARPFRVVPFFDPGVWGGQWMKDVCGLDSSEPQYAWCFDCVPEENSLLLGFGDVVIELPAMDLVLAHPRELLGERTFARFGAEFPIRFDFLDTMGGGNLSLQVHPLTDYIQQHFGMHYTQDESYYLLDAGPNALVYLGLKSDVDPNAMLADLKRAQAGEIPFPAERYVNQYPAAKHDHFLIPAGTVHCSGADSMVLEISATPFIFTFKMWDWGRVGLDSRPRPIHLDHAAANIQWSRDSAWAEANLLAQVRELARGENWVEEHTGLHELEFIETRRHWFCAAVEHNTLGTVNVLNLVEGPEAVVESPTDAFDPFVVHYAETFIVPAAVGAYTVRPHGPGVGKTLATIKAYVRGTQRA